MAFLDIFRSQAEIRHHAAVAYQKDIQRHKALMQAYIDSNERKLDLGEIIWKAAKGKRIPQMQRDINGHPTVPVEQQVAASDLALCAKERAEMLRLFDREFLQFRDEAWLERDEKKLLQRIQQFGDVTVANVSEDLRSSSEHLADLLLLMRSLSAILHKEELLIRELQTDIRVIYDLSDIVEKEGDIFRRLPIFKSEDLFDELMASAHDAVFLAALDEKIYESRKKLVKKFVQKRRTIAKSRREEHEADPNRKEEMEICKNIYQDLLEEVGAPFSSYKKAEAAMKRMDRIVQDDARLGNAVERRVRDPMLRNAIVKRFRNAYENIDFDESGFYT